MPGRTKDKDGKRVQLNVEHERGELSLAGWLHGMKGGWGYGEKDRLAEEARQRLQKKKLTREQEEAKAWRGGCKVLLKVGPPSTPLR